MNLESYMKNIIKDINCQEIVLLLLKIKRFQLRIY